MRHPDVFGHAASHSGDAGFELCYLADIPKFVAEVAARGSVEALVRELRTSTRRRELEHAAVNFVAMASCYSPNPRSPLGFDLPCDPETGELVPAVWRRWLAWDPVRAAAKHAAGLRRLKTLWFDAGTRDEFFLHLGARRLARELKRLKIPHRHEEHGGGHFDMAARFDVSLPLLSRRASA
jgi:S-formylglutathione hydrolase FrmB